MDRAAGSRCTRSQSKSDLLLELERVHKENEKLQDRVQILEERLEGMFQGMQAFSLHLSKLDVTVDSQRVLLAEVGDRLDGLVAGQLSGSCSDTVSIGNSSDILRNSQDLAVQPGSSSDVTGPHSRRLLVIGSSNVRRIESSIKKYVGKKGLVQCHTLPGGTVDDVIHTLPKALDSMGNGDVQIVAHVGTNDACRRGSEEIVSSFKKLASVIQENQNKRGCRLSLDVCSIVPRIDRGGKVWSRIDGINDRLNGICKDLGCGFLDLRSVLRGCRRSLDGSGVHYTHESAGRVGYNLACHFLG